MAQGHRATGARARSFSSRDIADRRWFDLGCSFFEPFLESAVLSISPTYLLYYLPLIIAISLVFGATRHEDLSLILRHAFHTARWITGFMAVVFALVLFLDWMV